MTPERRQEILDGVKSLITFLENTPEIEDVGSLSTLGIYVDENQFKKVVRSLGSTKKNSTDFFFYLEKRFGSVTVNFITDRENVCNKVQVGTETVTKKRVVKEAEYEEYEEEIPKYEWDCTPLLATEEL